MTITIPPYGSTTLKLRFKPLAEGIRTGLLTFTSNAPGSPHSVNLRGTAKNEIVIPPDPDPDTEYFGAAGGELRLNNGRGEITLLKTVNWYGFESVMMPSLLWKRPYKSTTFNGEPRIGMLEQMAQVGFNCIRIPLCEDITWPNRRMTAGNTISPWLNADLLMPGHNNQGTPEECIPSIEVLDKIISHAGSLGMRIVLDMHCLAPNVDNAAGTGGKWYTTATPGAAGGTTGAQGEARNEEQWIAAWEFLANRYKNNPIVIGFDLINEPHNCTWDDNPLTGLPAAIERCAARIQAINPDVLIICEGINGNVTFPNGESWGTSWGANLTGVRTRQIQLTKQNKLVYSPHEYLDLGGGAQMPWINNPDFPNILNYVWDHLWGYIAKEGIAPIWVGEFGGNFNAGQTKLQQWIAELSDYLNEDNMSWAYWAMPGMPLDNALQGILQANNDDLNTVTIGALQPLLDHVPGAVDPEIPELSYLTADGAKLRDQKGEQVMLRSINWYGFEQIFVPGGAWTRPFRTKVVGGVVKEGMLDEIKRIGFNSLRILFSQDCTWAGTKPQTAFGFWNTTFISPTLNGEFLNDDSQQNPQNVKTTIEIMDIFVGWCEELGIRIIFDMHCLAPDDNNILATGGKWYTTSTPGGTGSTSGTRREPRSEVQAIAAFVFLANRYKNRPVVAGFDLINEPHATTWDRDPLTGVVGFYERCGNAIHAVNPDVLIVCEGVAELGMNDGAVDHTPAGHENDPASLQGKYKWGVVWSGKLDEVDRINTMHVTLNVPNKIVYSPHEYASWPGDPAAHQWFYPEEYVGSSYAGLPYPQNMPAVWSRQWGYLAEQNIAPVWIGEFGSYFRVGGDPVGGGGASYAARHLAWDTEWMAALAEYCEQHSIGFAYWAWNPAGDPDGLLGQQPAGTWLDVQDFKMTLLAPFLPEGNDPSQSLSFSPGSLAFPDTQIGQTSSITVTVANLTAAAVPVTSAKDGPFTMSPTTFTVPANGTATFNVVFTPVAASSVAGSVSIMWGTNTMRVLPASGVGQVEPSNPGPDIDLPANAVGIVTIGDSITWGGFYENNGWAAKACFFENQLHRYRGTYAVIGSTSTQALNDQLPFVLAMDPPPKACVVATGTNNVASVTAGTNDVKAICATLIAANIWPILWTVPPRNDMLNQDASIASWNTIIKAYSQSMGLPLVDSHSVWKEPDSNRMRSDVDSGDGLHPNTHGFSVLGRAVAQNGWFSGVPHDGVFPLPTTTGGGNVVTNPVFTDTDNNGTANGLTLAAGFTGSISVQDGIRWQRITRPGSVVGANLASSFAPFTVTPGQRYSLAARVRWNTGGTIAARDGASWSAVISILFTDANWGFYQNSTFLIMGVDGDISEEGTLLRTDLVAPAGANRVLINLFSLLDAVPVKSQTTYIEFAQLAMRPGDFPLSGIDPPVETYPNALRDSSNQPLLDSNNLPLES